MQDSVGIIGNFVIVIGLLLLLLHVLKQLIPGPYSYVQRALNRLADLAFLGQAKKRGWPFAMLVHFPFLCACALLVAGIMTATWQTVLAGLVIATLAVLAKRGLASLHRLRSRRSRLPGRRR